MKVYSESRGIASQILDLDTRWTSLVYPQGRSPYPLDRSVRL